MSDLEKMSLVELRVAGRKMGVKNVTTYKKRELLELLLEVEKKQSSNVAESAVDNAENASADVKIKKTENRKKEEKKDDIPAAEHDNVAEQAGTAESDLKNSDKIENADEKRPQFQNSYVRNDYNEEHKNTYKNRTVPKIFFSDASLSIQLALHDTDHDRFHLPIPVGTLFHIPPCSLPTVY